MQCEIIGKLYDTMESIARKEKRPRHLGAAAPLNRADIQFIDAVAKNPGASATALAEALGVTRGAVTQWGNRLEGMGMIRRLPVEGNRKTKRIVLTPLGNTVRSERARAHQQANEEMCGFLSGLKPRQRDAIMDFLKLTQTLHISPFECVDGGCAARPEQQQTGR